MNPQSSQFVIGLNAVIAAVTDETPRILTIRSSEAPLPESSPGDSELDALPFGPLDPLGDRTLHLGLHRWVREQTGIELGYAEQLYTFGDRDRYAGGGESKRLISIAYLTLVRETAPAISAASWKNWYRYFPWEDWRDGRPPVLDNHLLPALQQWSTGTASVRELKERRERVDIAFGCHGATWNWERVLDRYELIYEAGLVQEARRDSKKIESTAFGRPMTLDHRRILATALDRLRGKLKYRPVVFELLPPTFTLLQLQRLAEALAGLRLHKQNFRRLVERGGLVEGTGQLDYDTGGRPAELFRFRRDVLKERPAPGVGLPGVR